MGWDGTQISPDEVEDTIRDQIRLEFGVSDDDIHVLVEDESKDFWSVACGEEGSVTGAIVHTRWGEDSWFEIKIISEVEGPMEMSAPLEVIDRLSPTDNETANEWRAHCRKIAAGVAAVIHPYNT